jgi:phenylpropionate dioxygenase-like ring-hydroxylating dioxygenase large terminal subunit
MSRGKIFLNEPVVFYRREDGAPVALEDRHIHRSLPPYQGSLVGDSIQCASHGLIYDCAGACIKIPGQPEVPSNARIKSYPVVDRHDCTWIRMGEAAKADEISISDFHWLNDPDWAVVTGYSYLAANYQLLTDNLLDLSHLAYVHGTTVGLPEMADFTDVKVESRGDNVHVKRWTIDTPQQRTYREIGGFSENIDRWQFIEFSPPAFAAVTTDGAIKGTGTTEGKPGKNRWNIMVCHAVTPESDGSSHYFWGLAHDRAKVVADPRVTKEYHRQVRQVIDEGIVVLTVQQKMIDLCPDAPTIDIRYDTGPLRARRVIEQLLKKQTPRLNKAQSTKAA